jgi:acylpyruvate hydrolase
VIASPPTAVAGIEEGTAVKLITYVAESGPRSGVLVGETVVDTLDAASAAGLEDSIDWSDNRGVVAADRETLDRLAHAAAEHATAGTSVGSLTDVRLGPPITGPDKVVCIGANYHDHLVETGLPRPEVPLFFAKFRNSLIGHREQIVIPPSTSKVDYEAELAFVIGRAAKNVEQADALDHVAGLTCLNDVSARDLQFQTSQFIAGKALDTFAPCGPALVLIDEIADVQALSIKAHLNGETVQDSNTADMIFPVAEIVSFLSRIMTLVPGDVISTGTPAGVGFVKDPPVFMHEGDLIEVEISEVGRLSNRLIAELP